MDQYRALISGGFNQAADILRASGKYGEPTVYTPSTWRLSQWEIQGRGWGERTVLLSFRLSGGSLSFGDDYMPMSSFSEQWFRKKLLEKVSDLVS